MKTALQSKTIRTGIVAIVAAIVAIILHYSGSVPLDPETLGASWSGAIMGALMVGLRLVTSVPIEKNESGFADLFIVAALAAFALLLVGSHGCGTTIVNGKHADLSIDEGPPCVVVVKIDGVIVSHIEAEDQCLVLEE